MHLADSLHCGILQASHTREETSKLTQTTFVTEQGAFYTYYII